MSTRDSDNRQKGEAVENLLRAFTPAALPPSLCQGLFVRIEETRRRSVRTRLWLAAAAAVLVAVVPLRLWWAGSGGASKAEPVGTALADATAGGNDLDANVSGEVLETTDVVGVQDAGTTPTQGGAYRIVLVTFVHRTWDAAGDPPERKVLSEQTSQSYVAVPLEIF